MTRSVYIGGGKGGVGKTTNAHLLCLGAILFNQPAAYVLTDPTRKVREVGRPYTILDGRLPADLSHILKAAQSTLNGWLFIDGGGNRPAFDAELSGEVHLCVLPFRASEEDLDTVANDLQRLPNAIAWPTAWPTNKFARKAAQYYIDALATAFPLRVITKPLVFVNSVSELLGAKLESPSTPVRQLARKAFQTIEDYLDERVGGNQPAATQDTVA